MYKVIRSFFFAGLVAALISPVVASANLGDTLGKSIERYGAPTKTMGPRRQFIMASCQIEETFDSTGKCVTVGYSKLDGMPFTQDELAQLRTINGFDGRTEVSYRQFTPPWPAESPLNKTPAVSLELWSYGGGYFEFQYCYKIQDKKFWLRSFAIPGDRTTN